MVYNPLCILAQYSRLCSRLSSDFQTLCVPELQSLAVGIFKVENICKNIGTRRKGEKKRKRRRWRKRHMLYSKRLLKKENKKNKKLKKMCHFSLY